MNCGRRQLAQMQKFIKRLERNKAGTYRATKWVEEDEDDPQPSRSFKAESTPLLRREWPNTDPRAWRLFGWSCAFYSDNGSIQSYYIVY
jgi:hypothetical protein